MVFMKSNKKGDYYMNEVNAINLTASRAINEAEAKTELNAKMLRLRTEYGYAPDKDITPDEMKERCDALVEAVEAAVEDYVNVTGKAPDIMRNTSHYKTSKEFPKKKYEGLQAYANVPEHRLKKAPLYTSEAIGNLLNFNANYLVRAHELDEIKNRTRKEWQRLEYEYVQRSDFNLRDLHEVLLNHMDETVLGNSIGKDYRNERKHWRKCSCYSCDNYFPTKKNHFMAEKRIWKFKEIDTGNKNSRYCSESCRKRQEKALVRLRNTGTLLPDYVYKPVSEEWVDKRHTKHNPSYDPAILTIISDEKSAENGKKTPHLVQY
jgi:hypothetical protein